MTLSFVCKDAKISDRDERANQNKEERKRKKNKDLKIENIKTMDYTKAIDIDYDNHIPLYCSLTITISFDI